MKRRCTIAKLDLKLYNLETKAVTDETGVDCTFCGDYPAEFLSDYEKTTGTKVLNCDIVLATPAFAILSDADYLKAAKIHVPEKRGGRE